LRLFDCGNENYQIEVANWIKNSGPGCVVDDLRERTDLRVWIYTLDEETIVGFGSLGPNEWSLRERGQVKKKLPVMVIPSLGLAREFHGQPTEATDKFDRYSSQILDDLIVKAKTDPRGVRWLGLYVHPENRPAISLYQRHDFEFLEKSFYNHKDFGVKYPAMILDLNRVPLA